jgi:hypothetical protein
MWCPAPLPEREQHQRKIRSENYKTPVGCLLEFYESDSSVEADEDTGDEARGGKTGAAPDAGGAAKAWRRTTRSAVGKQSTFSAVSVISVVKVVSASPPAVVTPSIPTPHSREVESEEEEELEKEKDEAIEELPVPMERQARRSESPAARRQWELVQKTSENALRCGLEA